MDTIEDRLAKLERNNRRFWILCVAAAALFGVGLCLGQSQLSDGKAIAERLSIITAEKFVLVDKEGHARIMLSEEEDGPALRIADSDDRERLRIVVTKMGPAILFYGDDGNARVGLGTFGNTPRLDLFSDWGSVQMKVSKAGPTFLLSDKDEKGRAMVGAFKEGPLFQLLDTRGSLRVGLGYRDDTGGLLTFFDEQDKPISSYPK
jgi:hypothetical protein